MMKTATCCLVRRFVRIPATHWVCVYSFWKCLYFCCVHRDRGGSRTKLWLSRPKENIWRGFTELRYYSSISHSFIFNHVVCFAFSAKVNCSHWQSKVKITASIKKELFTSLLYKFSNLTHWKSYLFLVYFPYIIIFILINASVLLFSLQLHRLLTLLLCSPLKSCTLICTSTHSKRQSMKFRKNLNVWESPVNK